MLHFAVIGHPIAHSRSPEIHQDFADQFGIELGYRRIDLSSEQLAPGVATFFATGGRGLNVTLPHKAAVLGLCSSIAPRAAHAGAVNTISQSADGLLGDNTDGVGLVRDLRRVVEHAGRTFSEQHIVVMGAGGAARGVISGLLDATTAPLAVIARDVLKAHALVRHFAPAHQIEVLEAGAVEHRCDVIINATSAGISQTSPHIEPGLVGRAWLAYDLSYSSDSKHLTPFLEACRGHGVETLSDGLGMLVEQAAEAFYLWHGRRPDTSAVLARLVEGKQ